MRHAPLKVGELARQAGVSVRTLHYYDEIGLLSPARHTPAGHRLYADEDVARLQRIKSLQYLGLSLDEIRACLEQPDFSLQQVIGLHIGRLRQQIALQQQLCQRLEALSARLGDPEPIAAETLLQVIEMMGLVNAYLSPEQLAAIDARGRQIGEARIREAEREWPALIAQVRAAMARGLPPSDPQAQELARRWLGLVREFSGGDPAIEQAMCEMYSREPAMQRNTGTDRSMFRYIERALEFTNEQGREVWRDAAHPNNP